MEEWTWPFTDNFTGPNWSDGKSQGSVLVSKRKPVSKLDRLSRIHDAQYFSAKNLQDLTDADWEYFENTREMSLVPSIIGAMPLVGNASLRWVYSALGMDEVNNRPDDYEQPVGMSNHDYVERLKKDDDSLMIGNDLFGKPGDWKGEESPEEVIRNRIQAKQREAEDDEYEIVYILPSTQLEKEVKWLEPAISTNVAREPPPTTLPVPAVTAMPTTVYPKPISSLAYNPKRVTSSMTGNTKYGVRTINKLLKRRKAIVGRR